MPSVYLEPTFVLHRRRYAESSYIVEALSLRFGRVGLMVKGARRPKSRLRGKLEPFRRLLVSWVGRGELATVTEVDVEHARVELRNESLFNGLYVNELLLRLLPRNDPHPGLFHSYAGVLAHLGKHGPVEPVLRIFETRLLSEIGYGLITDREADTGTRVVGDVEYCYVVDEGPRRARGACEGVRVRGSVLQALGHERFKDERDLVGAKRLMRELLSHYLGDKPLATRALMAEPL